MNILLKFLLVFNKIVSIQIRNSELRIWLFLTCKPKYVDEKKLKRKKVRKQLQVFVETALREIDR